MSATAKSAFNAIRNDRIEFQRTLLESTDPRCKTMQENARDEGMRDEGGRMNGEFVTRGPTVEAQLSPLTARQLTAINLLTLGKSVVATAASIKVDPSTIHRWKSGNALFIAELNRRQHDAYDAIVVGLRATMLQAVAELQRLMSDGQKSEKREVMWKMLGFLRPQKLFEPRSPTEAREVIDEKIREGRARRGEIVEAPIEEEDRIAWVTAQEGSSEGVVRAAEVGRSRPGIPDRATRNETQASTPLPSREGAGEGAAVDKIGCDPQQSVERTDTTPSNSSTRPVEVLGRSAAAHALPQPLPSREGSPINEETQVAAIGELLRAIDQSLLGAQTPVREEPTEDCASVPLTAPSSTADGSLPEHPCRHGRKG